MTISSPVGTVTTYTFTPDGAAGVVIIRYRV